MDTKPIIAGNWKMHKSVEEGVSFVDKIKNRILDKVEAKVIFCPPFTSLFSIVKALNGTDFGVGAQNAHFDVQGAYTGEISIGMLKSTGVQYVILGHSERRHIFGETDIWINKKIHATLNAELVPIFCIGETLDDRKSNQTAQVLENQLNLGLQGMESIDPVKMIIAYEPVWAIGTGETASLHQVAEAHGYIQSVLERMFGQVGYEVPILYGGSVNENNAAELIQTDCVSGFLIGGASIKEESFCNIVEQVSKFYKR